MNDNSNAEVAILTRDAGDRYRPTQLHPPGIRGALRAQELVCQVNSCRLYNVSEEQMRTCLFKAFLRWQESRHASQPFRAVLDIPPSDVEVVCNKPVPAPASDPLPLHLSEVDRGRGLEISSPKIRAISVGDALQNHILDRAPVI